MPDPQAQPPRPPGIPPYAVPPDKVSGVFATDVVVRTAGGKNPLGEMQTQVVILDFITSLPEGQILGSRVILTPDNFSRILQFFRRKTDKGGDFESLLPSA